MDLWPIVFRWLHILPAAVAIGGVFFQRMVLPADAPREVMLRCRQVFKRVIHTCILLLVASGTYNSIRLWPRFAARPGLLHGLWGLHVALALVVFGISLWLLTGKAPPAGHRRWTMMNLVLLIGVAMIASVLKTIRGG
jgi:hypothetical protein